MRKIKFFLIFCLTIFGISHYTDLDDKLLFKIFHQKNKNLIDENEHIYSLKEIKDIKKNLSGITYNKLSDTLFLITNSPRDIYELDKNGEVLRKIELKGFRDTEDLTHIKDNMFAILDEQLSTFYIVNIFDDTKEVSINNSIKQYSFDVRNFENFGLEGISYDIQEDEFYIVNERNPKKIVLIKGLMNNSEIEVNINNKLLDNNTYLADFSAIYFDSIKRTFYILSQESALLARVDDNKDFSKYFDLNNNEISSKMVNPEGVTKDNEGNIYIVGEPNIFLSIKKKI